MINIHQEVTIDVGDPQEQTLTLWLVSYGPPADDRTKDIWPAVVELLRRVCAHQGWLLECGDDPYREKSLAVFAEGFSWPVDPPDETDESRYLPYGEPGDDNSVF